ncbi:MAG TPA: hypothetical protein VEU51_02965 [Candidatus Acidoferrales bacterium]|nr:hypothetical protein [Candidatus Acidoferrales bacterium]
MKNSFAPSRLLMAVALAIAAIAVTASISQSASKCPNRFFKKIQIKGVGDTEANATTAYNNDLTAKINAAKPDCNNQECEDSTTETCTFKYATSKKPDCKPKQVGWKCTGNFRPGCFCLDADEDFVAATPAPAPAPKGGDSEKPKPGDSEKKE